MSKNICTPSSFEDPLIKLKLKYDAESILQSSAQSTINNKKTVESVISGVVPTAPTIIFRKPLWWHLTSQVQQLSKKAFIKEHYPKLALLLRDNHFYLLFVACFFQPEIDCPISYARFTCNLRQSTGRKPPAVLDIFPLIINHHYDSSTVQKIFVTPDLKFYPSQESSESICTIDFRNLIPSVKGNTENPVAPFWEYFPFEDKPLIDYRFGYVLIMKPKEAKSIYLTLNISAIVNTPYGEFKAYIKEKDKQSLQSEICSEFIEFI